MSILYSTKTCRLNGFVWIIFLFLFSFSCADNSDTKFKVDKEFEQYLIAKLDKADKESKVSFLQSEYSKFNKIVSTLGKLVSLTTKQREALEEMKRSGKVLGIDSSPIDESIKANKKELVKRVEEWQAEIRKLNAIIKVAKMYGISLQP